MKNYDLVQTMLDSYLIWKNDIKNIELEIETLKNDYDIPAMSYQERTGETFKINKEVENKVELKEEKIMNLQRNKRINEIRIEKIENALNVLSELEVKVLEFKYLNSPTQSWKYISYKLNASISTCRQAKIRAINKMIPLLCY